MARLIAKSFRLTSDGGIAIDREVGGLVHFELLGRPMQANAMRMVDGTVVINAPDLLEDTDREALAAYVAAHLTAAIAADGATTESGGLTLLGDSVLIE